MGNEAAKMIGELLKSRGERIAVAESISAGNIQAALSSNSWASDYFEGGITAYSLRQKVNLLGIDEQKAREVNCVSQDIARDMAVAVSLKFGTDYGIGTTGYAEPWGEIKEPHAYYSIAHGGIAFRGGCIDGTGLSRESMQIKVSNVVLKDLLYHLDLWIR